MMNFDADVAIVGGGPVGLGLAIDLAQRGVTSYVIERSIELHGIPKGQNLTQRSGEHFQAWGVSKEVRAASPIPHDYGNAGVVAYGHLLGEYSYDWFKRSAVNQFYSAENERLPQYEMERVLRTRVAELDEITICYGCTATALNQDDNAASVEFQNKKTDKISNITTQYLVGCDGARSFVRKAIRIEQDIDPHDRNMVLLVFKSTELNALLTKKYPGKSIYNTLAPELDGYWQFLGRVSLDGTWFYHAPVPLNTTAENFDFSAYLHSVIGAEFNIEFQHIGFWDLRMAVAKTYQNNRVFIAGDAAHSHPPYGGFGVNNGFEDVRNLSWKLAASLQGWAGEGLLKSYSQERQPVFTSTLRDFIARMISDDRDFCNTYAPDKALLAFQAAWAERAAAGNQDVTQYLPNYAGSSIISGQKGAKSGATGTHMFKARAGHHLAPLQDNVEIPLKLIGNSGFTLIEFGANSKLKRDFTKAAEKFNVPFSIVSIPKQAAENTYGAEFILLRPDGFVAWAGDIAIEGADQILRRACGK
jgi:2-polyprenyl-6-methoxyphenol hydroxylase-like FAD-dependent oxidoreductase